MQAVVLFVACILFHLLELSSAKSIYAHCNENNDLIKSLASSGFKLHLFNSLLKTVEEAELNSIVLSLAPLYPKYPTILSLEILNVVRKKNIKLYIEFFVFDDGDRANVSQINLERVVVQSSSFFADPKFYNGRILTAHKSYFTTKDDTDETDMLLVFSKVAGYDNCTLPLPNINTYPLLYLMNNSSNILYSTSKLSNFITSRFSPYNLWTNILDRIFNFLLGISNKEDIHYLPLSYEAPIIQTMYTMNETMPSNAIGMAVDNTIDWFINSGMLNSSFKLHKKNTKLTAFGKLGVIEGFTTSILPDGSQEKARALRNDCITETAMVFAMKYYLSIDTPTSGEKYKVVSSNLLNYAWIHGTFLNGFFPNLSPGDPNGNTFGLLKWDDSTTASISTFYKDDSARSLLAGIAVSALLRTEQYNTVLASSILSNLRITGVNGFGPPSSSFLEIIQNGWESYYNNDFSNVGSNYSPHYQCYMWAVYLWGYQNTGYQPLYDRAYNAIEHMMEHYPAYWIPTSNGITMQRARMLLPLAWLVNVNRTEKHVNWLHTVMNGLLERQDDLTGAFREEISAKGWNRSARIPNNNDYGTFEAPLNQENTDPVSDLLYTSNFALIGLNEAYHSLLSKNHTVAKSLDKLKDFLIRIQSKSKNKMYSGAYFRAFDFEKWEVWGSDADAGWGVWSVETGWTQTWIATALGLNHLNTSFWEVTQKNVNLQEELEGWVEYFF